jgi:hypothetical protein
VASVGAVKLCVTFSNLVVLGVAVSF